MPDNARGSPAGFLHRCVMIVVRGVHKIYKRTLSPLFGQACRFTPYCSDYAVEAIDVHGIFKGSLLAAWRILRCNPLCRGGEDPVPPRTEKGRAELRSK